MAVRRRDGGGGWEGAVVLVTGGSSGIGLATARRLQHLGATCVTVDVQRPAPDAARHHLVADVGDPVAWREVVAEVESRFGGIDAGHLNAGVSTGEADLERLDDDRYRHILRVNVDGVVYGMRALIPALERRGGGAIVATASLAGLTAFAHDPVYTMTKHAVVGLVRSVAPRLQGRGITVNAVCPGVTETPLIAPDLAALRAADFPLLSADDVAEAVLLAFASEETGQAWVCQPGREPLQFHFPGVPGPRVPGALGVLPPLP